MADADKEYAREEAQAKIRYQEAIVKAWMHKDEEYRKAMVVESIVPYVAPTPAIVSKPKPRRHHHSYHEKHHDKYDSSY